MRNTVWCRLLSRTALMMGLLIFPTLRSPHNRPGIMDNATRLTVRGAESCHWLSPQDAQVCMCLNTRYPMMYVLNMVTGKLQQEEACSKEEKQRFTYFMFHPWPMFASMNLLPVLQGRAAPSERVRSERLCDLSILSQLPKNCTVKEVAMSRDGKQLAYLLEFTRLTPLDLFMTRLDPHWKAHPVRVRALYQSDRCGGNMEAIGWQPDHDEEPHTKTRTANIPFAYSLAWVPDGKHLSFIHDHAVWVAPAKAEEWTPDPEVLRPGPGWGL